MMKKLIFLLFFLISMQFVIAATIHGTVYSPYLERLDKAIVLINTAPKQTYIATDGKYTFNVPQGKYNIEAVYSGEGNLYYLEQNITVGLEGEYVIDLILFPSFADIEQIGLEIEIPEVDKERAKYKLYAMVIIALIILGSYGYIIYNKKYRKHEKPTLKESKEELSPDLKKIIDFIREHEGRITQKDIRKEFPLSEAKISLMLAELEERGKVQKIKKGRGNIIILK